MSVIEETITEKAEDFSNWYKDFLKKEKGFAAGDEWFDKVQTHHQELRETIGGVRRIRTFSLDDSQNAADAKQCQQYISQIKEIIPDIEKLTGGSEKLLFPEITIGKRKMKTGKVLLQWFNRQESYDQNKYNALSNIISKLGEIWSSSRTTKSEMTVMMTTSAKSFALLGHLGPDEESCFRQGSTNADNKYVLGQTPNTFILLVKENGKNIARFWGFTVEKEVYTLANFYIKSGVHRGNVFEAVRLFFADLLQIDRKDLKELEHLGSVEEGSYVYFNSVSWTYCKEDPQEEQHLEPISEGIVEDFECENCGDIVDRDDEWEMVDGMRCCYNCSEESSWCEYTRTSTFDKMSWVTNKDGKPMHVKRSLVGDIFIQCSNCKEGHHPSLLQPIKDGQYCKSCTKRIGTV